MIRVKSGLKKNRITFGDSFSASFCTQEAT